MNYLSLFSGIGAFEKAFKNLGIEYNLVGFSEIDKYAVKSYCAIHGVDESLNLGDITKIDETKLPKIDFCTYGFPCQDIAICGKLQGLFNDDGTKTRSGLFFDALRIIEYTQPKIAIAENVKNLLSKKFNAQFQIVLASLEAAGYNNYYTVLNSKHFGIPQNRERVFIVSIRKDIDTGVFEFPKGYPLELRLKDLLEPEVDEKYYLSEAMFNYVFNMVKEHKGIGFSDGVDSSFVNPQIAQTIGCRSASYQRSGTTNYVCDDFDEPLKVSDMKEMLKTDEVIQIGNCRPTKNRVNPNQGRIYDTEGIAPCLNAMGGGNREPHIVVDDIEVYDVYNRRKIDSDVVGTITTGCSRNASGTFAVTDIRKRIRKLTPKECFRLMGFADEDFERSKKSLNDFFYKGKDKSNTQLYKQAGNSIVVDVAEELLCMLFDEDGDLYV